MREKERFRMPPTHQVGLGHNGTYQLLGVSVSVPYYRIASGVHDSTIHSPSDGARVNQSVSTTEPAGEE